MPLAVALAGFALLAAMFAAVDKRASPRNHERRAQVAKNPSVGCADGGGLCRGVVKRFSERNGWGFITCDGPLSARIRDVRFYRADKLALRLSVGDAVVFRAVPDTDAPGWLMAKDLQRTGDTAVTGAAAALTAASIPKVPAAAEEQEAEEEKGEDGEGEQRSQLRSPSLRQRWAPPQPSSSPLPGALAGVAPGPAPVEVAGAGMEAAGKEEALLLRDPVVAGASRWRRDDAFRVAVRNATSGAAAGEQAQWERREGGGVATSPGGAAGSGVVREALEGWLAELEEDPPVAAETGTAGNSCSDDA